MKSIVWGFIEYFNGLKISFTEKSLRKHLVILALINATLFLLTISGLVSQIDVFLRAHVVIPDTFFQKIYYGLAYVVALIATFLVSAVLVYFLNQVVFTGIYGDVLSKKCFDYKNLAVQPPKRNFLEHVQHNIGKILKVSLVLALTIGGFFIAVIPGLGFVGVFVSALVLSFDMMDYGFDVLGLTIGERFAFFKTHFLIFVGFSLGLLIVMAAPLFNVLLVPSSVVAASHILAEIKSRKTPS